MRRPSGETGDAEITGELVGGTGEEELVKRLIALPPGFRYSLTVTVERVGITDWTVDGGLKVERPKKKS